MNRRLIILKTVLWAFVGGLVVLTFARFSQGLGSTTHLSDAAPWGLWIALDVMAGVALAAGGFVLAGTVYIFGLEKYRPLVRPAILTAFLGYAAVATGLLYDLGLPWHIWKPMVNWQYHSVLFEVAACVMTYLTVLALEFSPVVLEHPALRHPLFRSALTFLKKVTIPLVIAGIVLSTLHQSSLGSLFLITPHRLHPLWYSPIIYVLFFVSAVGLGMAMVMIESLLSAFFYRHKVHMDLFPKLGAAAAVVLTFYAILRVGDLVIRGIGLDGSWMSALFIAELSVSSILPAALLSIPRVRRSVAGIAVCASMVVVGMIWNRVDVAIVAIARPEGMAYFPSWMEFGVSFGVISAFALVFLFFVERFRVYGEEARTVPPSRSHDPATLDGLSPVVLSAPRRYSMAFVAAAAVAVLFLPEGALAGASPRETPVVPALTVEGMRLAGKTPGAARLAVRGGQALPKGAEAVELMVIDGNRDGRFVLFDHALHEEKLGGDEGCAECHHLNKPMDRQTSCWECHRDHYEPTDLFDHALHEEKLGGNEGCAQCHADDSAPKTRATASACGACHADDVVPGSVVSPPEERWRDAPGYMDAMHGLCIACHEKRVKEFPGELPEDFASCAACHDADDVEGFKRLEPSKEGHGH